MPTLNFNLLIYKAGLKAIESIASEYINDFILDSKNPTRAASYNNVRKLFNKELTS